MMTPFQTDERFNVSTHCTFTKIQFSTSSEKIWIVCVWLVECRRMHMDRDRMGVGGYERSRQEKGLGVTRQTQFGVAVVKSINYLLIVVFEWTSGDWYEHVNMLSLIHI